jgi:hypothetical protein
MTSDLKYLTYQQYLDLPEIPEIKARGPKAQTLMEPAEVIRTPHQPHPSRQDRLRVRDGPLPADQWCQGGAEGGVEPLDVRRIDPVPALGGYQDSPIASSVPRITRHSTLTMRRRA